MGDRITMVGHSLGGALATLCMIDCLDEFPESNISGYTIGSPRVLTNRSQKVLTGLFDYISRLWNKKDLITKLPVAMLGFKHIGESYNLKPCTTLLGPFKFHKIDAYIKMIENEMGMK